MRAGLAAALALIAALTGPAPAQTDDDTAEALFIEAETLAPFKWVSRPIVVFADSPNDPRFIEQVNLLRQRPGELLERDVVVILDTDSETPSDVRQQLRPRGFMLAIVGKDGRVALRKPSPWDVREITRAIDKFPLRQQEIRDAKAAAGAG